MAADRSSIEWTETTWNPVRGCSRISPGCEHCYAEAIAARFSGPGLAYEGLAEMGAHGPRWTRKLRLVDDSIMAPHSWRRARRIFVNSMSDLFHEDVPFEYIGAVFAVMAATRHHTFQILTKRAGKMREWYCWAKDVIQRTGGVHGLASYGAKHLGGNATYLQALTRRCDWPLPHVWQGVSVESEDYVDRIIELLDVDAAVRFVSYEPGLSGVDFRPGLSPSSAGLAVMHHNRTGHPCSGGGDEAYCEDRSCGASWRNGKGIDWLIVGGESGADARPFEVAWAADAIEACRTANVAVFVKQLGSHVIARGDGRRVRLKDKKGGDMSEWPKDLRVRQYPRTDGRPVWTDDEAPEAHP